MKPKSRRILLAISSGALVLVALATMGLRSFFDRPGESALSMVPENSIAVIVLDLQPGPGQLGAFRKLLSSAQDANVGKHIDTLVSPQLGEYSWIKEATPYLRRSGVIAFLPSGRGQQHSASDASNPVLILPISNGPAVAAIFQQHLQADGRNSYSDPKSKAHVALIQDAVVIAQNANDVMAVQSCVADSSTSLASLAGYQKARKAIDSDANLMVFVSGSVFGPADSHGWFGAGVAVRDVGLALSCNVPISAKSWTPYKDLAAMQPIRRDLYDHLPAGAYGVTAVSQPEALWRFAEDLCADSKSSLKGLRNVAKSLNRETGINLDAPTSTTLMGTAVFASYPSRTNPAFGYDALFVFDDANGARPADVADGVRKYTERLLEHRGNREPIFADIELGQAHGYVLTPAACRREEDDMVKATDPSLRAFFRGKTLAYATVGEAVLVATSTDLLARATRAYQGQGPLLSHDGQFASDQSLGKDGPQIIVDCNAKRVGEGVQSSVHWDGLSKADQAAGQDAIRTTEGLDTPGTFAFRAGPDTATIQMFIPVDYAHVSQAVKRQASELDKFLSGPFGAMVMPSGKPIPHRDRES